MATYVRSLDGSIKTGLISCVAGSTGTTAGNLVKLTAGGTLVQNTTTKQVTKTFCVVDVVGSEGANAQIFGIAVNTATSGNAVDVLPLTVGDVVNMPFTNGTADATSQNITNTGTILGLNVGAGTINNGKTTVDVVKTTGAGRCMLILAQDTTNKVCEAVLVQPTAA